jgi:hypothetical protein
MAVTLTSCHLGFEASPHFVAADLDGDGETELVFLDCAGQSLVCLHPDGQAEWSTYLGHVAPQEHACHLCCCGTSNEVGPTLAFAAGSTVYVASAITGQTAAVREFSSQVVALKVGRAGERTVVWVTLENGDLDLLDENLEGIWSMPFAGRHNDRSLHLGDLDGDGNDEAVFSFSDHGRLLVVNSEGHILWEAPVPGGDSHIEDAVIADIDGDGEAELVVPERCTCFAADGSVKWEVPPSEGLAHGQQVYAARLRQDLRGRQVLVCDYWTETPNLMLLGSEGKVLWRRLFDRQFCLCGCVDWLGTGPMICAAEQLPKPAKAPYLGWVMDADAVEVDRFEFADEPSGSLRFQGCVGCAAARAVDVNGDGREELVVLGFSGAFHVLGGSAPAEDPAPQASP